MINLHESMGPGRDRTRDPWIFSQERIYSQTRYRLRYTARWLTLVMCGSRRGGGDRGSRSPPPWKITTIYGSLAILVRIPLKLQSYQSSIQCWAIIGAQAKRHLNGVSLAGRWWPANSGVWIFPPLIKQKKKNVKVGPLWQNFLDPRMWLLADLICH